MPLARFSTTSLAIDHCMKGVQNSVVLAANSYLRRLLGNGVVDMITQTFQKDEDVHICCLLAAAELCGSEESGKHCNILQKFNTVHVLVSDLRKRCSCCNDYSVNEREVSLRKLLSALENIASSDVHKETLLRCGVIDVIYDVVSKRIV
eukprot:137626-Hanusia_phi.AAC.2